MRSSSRRVRAIWNRRIKPMNASMPMNSALGTSRQMSTQTMALTQASYTTGLVAPTPQPSGVAGGAYR